MVSRTSSFLCIRCGIILVDFPTPPDLCPKCGGVELINLGKEGEYNLKEIRKEHHVPFRPDQYYKYTGQEN